MPDIVVIPPGASVSLSPTASGFAHGFGLFETLRLSGGQLEFWAAHWQRLSASAAFFQLALPAEDAVLDALARCARPLDRGEGILKLSLIKDGADTRLLVYTRPPLPAPPGRRLLFDPAYPIAPESLLAGYKTHNYMETLHLLQTARDRGYYDRVRVDTAGHLAETAGANLFFFERGRLRTPSIASGLLPGVVRGALVGTAELDVEEGAYAPERLLGAEFAFITNSTCGMEVIEGVDGLPGAASINLPTQLPALDRIRETLDRLRADKGHKLI